MTHNENYNFVFIHGWGMDCGIWSKISEAFPAENSSFLDLGFTGSESNLDALSLPDRPTIYITHSLGTAYALKHHVQNIDVLITINGFSCFEDFVEPRILQTMQKQLVRNPAAQMKSFWDNCGLDQNTQNDLDGRLNTDRLQKGLEWLIRWDMYQELQVLAAPVLSLGGAQDKILPIDQMQMHWSGFDLRINEEGDHVLPLSQADWCIENIKGFIGELELEK